MPKTDTTKPKTEKKNADTGTKKKKKKKDPNKPKTPQSAFLYFSAAKREEVVKGHPGIAFKDIGKLLGEAWRAASDDDKKPYETQAEKDRMRYKKEMETYVPPPNTENSDDDKKKRKRKKKGS